MLYSFLANFEFRCDEMTLELLRISKMDISQRLEPRATQRYRHRVRCCFARLSTLIDHKAVVSDSCRKRQEIVSIKNNYLKKRLQLLHTFITCRVNRHRYS